MHQGAVCWFGVGVKPSGLASSLSVVFDFLAGFFHFVASFFARLLGLIGGFVYSLLGVIDASLGLGAHVASGVFSLLGNGSHDYLPSLEKIQRTTRARTRALALRPPVPRGHGPRRRPSAKSR